MRGSTAGAAAVAVLCSFVLIGGVCAFRVHGEEKAAAAVSADEEEEWQTSMLQSLKVGDAAKEIQKAAEVRQYLESERGAQDHNARATLAMLLLRNGQVGPAAVEAERAVEVGEENARRAARERRKRKTRKVKKSSVKQNKKGKKKHKKKSRVNKGDVDAGDVLVNMDASLYALAAETAQAAGYFGSGIRYRLKQIDMLPYVGAVQVDELYATAEVRSAIDAYAALAVLLQGIDGHEDQAQIAYHKVLTAQPGLTKCRYGLAKLQFALGNETGAAHHWRVCASFAFSCASCLADLSV